MARIELIASTSDASKEVELRQGVKEAFDEIEGLSVEATFESRDRAISGAEIAIGYIIGLASGATIELVKAAVNKQLEARRVRANLELSKLDDENDPAEPM